MLSVACITSLPAFCGVVGRVHVLLCGLIRSGNCARLAYDISMFTKEAARRMFYIDRELDYSSAIDSKHRESWGSPAWYPAIVRLHTELPVQDVPLHWHLGAELVYAKYGEVGIFIDGETVVIRDGQVCLINSRALHAIRPMPHDDGQSVLSITFDGEYLSRISPGLANQQLLQGVAFGTEPAEGVVGDSRLIELCDDVIACLADESNVQLIRLNALLYTVLLHILQSCRCEGASVTESGDRRGIDDGGEAQARTSTVVPMHDEASARARAITDYMERHYDQPITVAQIADRFNYSREYFSRAFKRDIGVTPDRYLTEIRLQSAMDDLLNSDDPIADVAQRNGFPSAKTFSRSFAARFSMTPAAYRRHRTPAEP